MAKAKYTKQKNGYFQARVWDGSYVDGKKHYITIRSKKSSKDLEAKVAAYNDKIKNLEAVRDKNILFLDYAGRWLTVYKAEATNNTKRMYQNIIEKPVCGLTAHIFRHNYCTSLCYQIPRISIKNIASLLGDDEAMVLRIYNHIMLEKEDTAGAVEAALSM